MRFGVSFLPDADPSTKSAQTYFSDALALSELADKAGLHFIKMTEHYWQVDFGAMRGEEAHRTLTLFIEKVLPYCYGA